MADSNSPAPKAPTASTSVPKAAPGNYNSIAAQYARAKAVKDAEDKKKLEAATVQNMIGKGNAKRKSTIERLNERKKERFGREWIWGVGFFIWIL